MGYDYFVTEQFKDKIDAWAENTAEAAKQESLAVVSSQIKVLKTQTGWLYALLIFLLGAYITHAMMHQFSDDPNNIGYLIFFSLAWLLCVAGIAYNVVNKIIAEHLAAMLVPLTKVTLYSYLRFTPKGAIAGTGMLFLLTSFLCRAINYNYGI